MEYPNIKSSSLADYTVLLVDDDKTIRDVIMLHLGRLGFTHFLQASNGHEAYELLLHSPHTVDLILCDWEMPKTTGLTFLKNVRADHKFKDIPFIMITAQQTQERQKITEAAQHDVNAYIVKPFGAETLKQKVFQVLFGAVEKKPESA